MVDRRNAEAFEPGPANAQTGWQTDIVCDDLLLV
jgi:hypothetical protein